MNILPKTAWLILIAGLFLFSFCQASGQTNSPTEWLVLGPIPVADGETENIDEEQQRAAIIIDHIDPAMVEDISVGQTLTIANKSYKWQQVIEKNQVVDFDELFDEKDYVAAYAFIEIENAEDSLYNNYVGRYAYPGGAVLTVSTENNQLFAQLSGQPRLEIFPKGDDEFFWKVVDAKVRFVSDQAGTVIHAVHTQAGQTFEAPKMEEEAAVEADSSILETYVGAYDLKGTAVTVTRQDDQLYLQVSGQPKFEIYPRSTTEFFMKAVNADISFVENENKEVDRLILNQGGRTFTLPRTN